MHGSVLNIKIPHPPILNVINICEYTSMGKLNIAGVEDLGEVIRRGMKGWIPILGTLYSQKVVVSIVFYTPWIVTKRQQKNTTLRI